MSSRVNFPEDTFGLLAKMEKTMVAKQTEISKIVGIEQIGIFFKFPNEHRNDYRQNNRVDSNQNTCFTIHHLAEHDVIMRSRTKHRFDTSIRF